MKHAYVSVVSLGILALSACSSGTVTPPGSDASTTPQPGENGGGADAASPRADAATTPEEDASSTHDAGTHTDAAGDAQVTLDLNYFAEGNWTTSSTQTSCGATFAGGATATRVAGTTDRFSVVFTTQYYGLTLAFSCTIVSGGAFTCAAFSRQAPVGACFANVLFKDVAGTITGSLGVPNQRATVTISAKVERVGNGGGQCNILSCPEGPVAGTAIVAQ